MLEQFLTHFLAFLFIYSACAKWRNLAAFTDQLLKMRVVPSNAVRIVAPLVVAAEMLAGVFLLLPWHRLWALLAAGVMLTVFTTVVVRLVRRREPVSCFCFGSGGGNVTSRTIWRNLFLILVSILAIVSAGDASHWQASAIASIYSVSAVCVFVSALDLDDLWQRSRNFI